LLWLGGALPSIRAGEYDAGVFPLNKGEERTIRYRDPASLRSVYIPPTPPPATVRVAMPGEAEQPLSLDEAILLTLEDSEVVRRLAGTIAVSSGQTIYNPAIAATSIDQQRAAFDPNVRVDNTWSQNEPPSAFAHPFDPDRTILGGIKTENHNVTMGLNQKNLSGGTARLGFGNDVSRFDPGIFALNPQNRYATELSYTQPLLRGAGVLANRVPIVLARIDTERSFFQLNDSVQELVRGTIEAYWAVVSARTDVWARGIQVQQAEELVLFSNARLRTGFDDVTVPAQAESALAQFRANLISSRANLLNREAALENILGIGPTVPVRFVPVTPPTKDRIGFDWNLLTQVAEQRRPDLIELKLVLEADQQRLLLARNQTRPNVDLVGLYRWNGLEGRMPDRTRIGSQGDQYTDWTLGVNFSVPLYLRQERAATRSANLVVARDRAALDQGVHSALHILALSYRNLDTAYEQYGAFQAAREAARKNLMRQYAAYATGNQVLFVNVLQAISDWGNSVSLEAQALAQYNTELANIERESGTILETHGIFFFEDRFCSLGPLWICPPCGKLYPRDIRPGPNQPRYPVTNEPAENIFDLENYPRRLPAIESDLEEQPLPPPGPELLPEGDRQSARGPVLRRR
jgi:outer membrane protein TolC